ncbi:N-acetylglucosamine-6-phosphate deacetylase [Clavibacter nebraskensis]|uniref:N-acetylglucosamine-6-phosphate deacetylase n=2 Tax=Clavibacter nebraskensis TaxID=31963 RepID=A0A399QDD7_9MICO|nr:N-acetylglucosamine-6-phosphate deacetylase [Clavibacter nebraskensis]KXU20272.1 N-acetylglucosamine-6-phosphate deacetylase [Clavibacter nebraskensis]OAH21451.1 N-acetylglucosamine-6-phosphate deacetylase [Clavibacter nebraskensis]QGV67211.1 N-acetylglucosamine-6-phosphate deacetylase [Clavibacter nebraskensis]QGV70009.1 N-acetylglucosamine-6-phosphate deacetylase [Clavibacter nebraskensis]QGV72800.1 N-acetylglucosamine-6-phosphate deacetylase [Clavibacter nebraskensis]
MSAHDETVTTLLRAARAVDARGAVDDAWVLMDGDRITAVSSGREAPPADRTVDLGDATLVPGFVDLHVHGGAGGSHDDGADGIRAAVALHRRHGTTRSVLSLVANPVPDLVRSLGRIRDAMTDDPTVLGAHLEGPFLSPHAAGAHAHEHLVDPTPARIEALLEAGEGVLRQVTIAPELDGALDAIRRLVAAGVVAAVGHTTCSGDVARSAFDADATVLTHAFNAMPGIHHREPGPIMAAVADERVTLELILDGVHVAPSVAGLLLRAAPGRVALVTDAMAAAGSADGRYRLGALDVDVRDGSARLAGADTIAGSTLTQDQALRIAVREVGLALPDAIAALTLVPARALGVDDRLGLLRAGHAADVVALSPDLAVTRVWAAGTELPTG